MIAANRITVVINVESNQNHQIFVYFKCIRLHRKVAEFDQFKRTKINVLNIALPD